MPQTLLLFFCGSHRPIATSKVCQCHRAHTPDRSIYIVGETTASSCRLCYYSPFVAPFSPELHVYTMPVRFPMIFSHKHPQTSKTIVDATSTTRSRSSTTITTLEKEFGACEPPKSGTAATRSSSFLILSHFVSY